ncbi:unnamed protein product [Mycena citricolor]|uniref:rRNA-processing protein EFG1 n=1 Tax=Mycena citricolor TaxID=2018698 RepID=A0AAD2HVM1_9AGAR|nr:unnamed protein product [Mycena citricolor]
MGPVRTHKSRKGPEESSPNAVAGPSKPRKQYPPQNSDNGKPGVSKIKASLRQTRRLLAKGNLAANIRVETERRLKALEADLITAEQGKKERTMAVRYHGPKFFERQKVLRKLIQAKKSLAEEDTSELRVSVADLRVDLNYTLHYPKTKKYISLFPPELRAGEAQDLPLDPGREEVRAWIRSQMKGGQLSIEPELHMDSRSVNDGGAQEWTNQQRNKRSKKKKDLKEEPVEPDDTEDAFFEQNMSEEDS